MAITRSVLAHYLKIINRHFIRNRSYTILNLLGLAVGFAVAILSATYVYFETHFENFHHNADRIYRATYLYTPPADFQTHWARVPFDYINQLPDEFPGIRKLVRFQNHARKYVRIGNEKFTPKHAYVTDGDVFDVFDFHLIAGNPSRALTEPHSIVISESLAEKYFGDEDPMGKEVFVIGDFDSAETLHRITGVMKDLPANTHLPIEILFSFRNKEERSGWAYTYILLEDAASIEQVEAGMPAFIRKHDEAGEATNTSIVFQALGNIHLDSNLAREIVPNGDRFYVRVIGFAGALILVMTVINFMNLNSAMSLGRAREIGMRKVMGVSRQQLVAYLMGESVVNHLVALVIGAGIAYLLFPYLQSLIAIEFLPDIWLFAVVITTIAVGLGLAAGTYPVMLLASLRPMTVLKTAKAISFAGKEHTFSLKRVMVTLQFAISILLVGSALIAYTQFKYLLNKDLGMQSEQIIAIPGVPDQVKVKFEAFRDRLVSHPGIADVSACMEVPSREIRDSGPVLVEGVNDNPAAAPRMDIQVIDDNFTSLVSLNFLAGSNLRPTSTALPEFTETFTIFDYMRTTPREYIINEAAMRKLGWTSPQEALGHKISWSIGNIALASGPIVGVVQDFHQESLRNQVDPLIMVREPIWLRTFLIKVGTEDIQSTIDKISAEWNDLFPFYPLEYFFLDDLYNKLYQGERVQVQLLFIFSGLTILIAFLGVLGLIAYSLKSRTKEIAVRKVLGATLGSLVRLMSREYMAVVVIAAAISIPISIYGVQQWLSGFAYRVDISPLSYVVALALILFLLVITVSVQTFRTARLNPADTLREE